MSGKHTDYEVFEQTTEARRLLREEELILEVTEALTTALGEGKVTRTELAERLGKSKGFVSQILAGGRNLTLRTVADVADALGQTVRVKICDREQWVDEALESIVPEVWSWNASQRPTFRVVSRGEMTLVPHAVKVEGAA